jgi:hypothetical protein
MLEYMSHLNNADSNYLIAQWGKKIVPVASASIYRDFFCEKYITLVLIRSFVIGWAKNVLNSLDKEYSFDLSLVSGVKNERGIFCYHKCGFYPRIVIQENVHWDEIFWLHMKRVQPLDDDSISEKCRDLFDSIIRSLQSVDPEERQFLIHFIQIWWTIIIDLSVHLIKKY